MQTQNIACDCGNLPSIDESEGTGIYVEDDKMKFICYPCWCMENYGKKVITTILKPYYLKV